MIKKKIGNNMITNSKYNYPTKSDDSHCRWSPFDGDGAIVYAAPIPLTATEEQIRPVFAKYGTIINFALGQDDRYGPRGGGHCFVEYSTFEEALMAIEDLSDKIPPIEFSDQPMDVRFAAVRRKCTPSVAQQEQSEQQWHPRADEDYNSDDEIGVPCHWGYTLNDKAHATFDPVAKFCLKKYNEKYNTSYKFVELVLVVSQFYWPPEHYYTIKAANLAEDSLVFFQARSVLNPGKPEVVVECKISDDPYVTPSDRLPLHDDSGCPEVRTLIAAF